MIAIWINPSGEKMQMLLMCVFDFQPLWFLFCFVQFALCCRGNFGPSQAPHTLSASRKGHFLPMVLMNQLMSFPVGGLIFAFGWCCNTKRRTRRPKRSHLYIGVAVKPNASWMALWTHPLVLYQNKTRPRTPVALTSRGRPHGSPVFGDSFSFLTSPVASS